MRVGQMWVYGGHYHSFVTYIHALFRFLCLTLKFTAYLFLQYDFVLYFGATLDQHETDKKIGTGWFEVF